MKKIELSNVLMLIQEVSKKDQFKYLAPFAQRNFFIDDKGMFDNPWTSGSCIRAP